MIPARFSHILFGLILTCLMSLIITGVATLRTAGLAENFVELWFNAWVPSWAVAFPVVIFVAPFARRLSERLIKSA